MQDVVITAFPSMSPVQRPRFYTPQEMDLCRPERARETFLAAIERPHLSARMWIRWTRV